MNNQKKRTDPREFIIYLAICVLFVLASILPNSGIRKQFDYILVPLFVNSKKSSYQASILLFELTNKSSVLEENLQLRRQIKELESRDVDLQSKNDQLARLEQEQKISLPNPKKMKLLPFSGTQNAFSSDPFVKLYMGENASKYLNRPVYYQSNVLFGFVFETSEDYAFVAPFYSPRIKFNIPVQSARDISQVGFVNKIQDGKVLIQNIPKDAVLKNGDIWITSNLREEVPPALVIGKIQSFEVDRNSGFQKAILDTGFDLKSTNYLFVEEI